MEHAIMMRVRPSLVSLAAVVSGLALSSGCNRGTPAISTSVKPDQTSSSAGGSRPGSTPAAAERPVVVDALTLIKDFKKNQEQVFENYGGKRLEVEGGVYEEEKPATRGQPLVVKMVQVDRPDGPLIEPIICLFEPGSESYDKAFMLSLGQKVTVRGRYDTAKPKNGSVVFAPHLFQCEVAAAGPDPAIVVTAEELTRAFTTDPKAAEAKYKEKPVIVEGKVAQLEHFEDKERGVDGYTVHLEGSSKDGKPAHVEIFNTTRDVAGLQKGQNARLKGKCVSGTGETVSVLFSRVVK
jgi:hypothetical protein